MNSWHTGICNCMPIQDNGNAQWSNKPPAVKLVQSSPTCTLSWSQKLTALECLFVLIEYSFIFLRTKFKKMSFTAF